MHAYLLVFSYFWMIVAAILGLRLGISSLGFGARIDEVVGRNDLATYHALTRGFNWSKTVHAHTFLFSVVSATTYFALGQSAYGNLAKDIIAAGLMAGSVGWTLGASRQIRPVMGLSDFVFLFSVIGTGYGLLAARIPALLP